MIEEGTCEKCNATIMDTIVITTPCCGSQVCIDCVKDNTCPMCGMKVIIDTSGEFPTVELDETI